MDTDGEEDEVQIPESCSTLDMDTEQELLLLLLLPPLLLQCTPGTGAVSDVAVTVVLKPKFNCPSCGLFSPI